MTVIEEHHKEWRRKVELYHELYKQYVGVKRLPRKLHLLSTISVSVLNSREAMEFLWNHTRSEEQYEYIIGALKLLSNLRDSLIDWEGVDKWENMSSEQRKELLHRMMEVIEE